MEYTQRISSYSAFQFMVKNSPISSDSQRLLDFLLLLLLFFFFFFVVQLQTFVENFIPGKQFWRKQLLN